MKTILIFTVGGSHQPILTSIAQHQPDFAYFLCSSDSGKTITGSGLCIKSRPDQDKFDLPNIPTQAGLPTDRYRVHLIEHVDDLNYCYLEALEVIEKARSEFPESRIIVDYTGGTKSMTAGLASAALDDGCCEIIVVTGKRADLTKVQDMTQFVRPIWIWDTQAHRRCRIAAEMVKRFDYAGAEQLLREVAARYASASTAAMLQRGIQLCRAFDGWDKFDHAKAKPLLQPFKGEFPTHWHFLRAVLGETPAHGFELVQDLLMNAGRRAAQGRYDDAVGRLYRATELTAQIWLKHRHGIDTGNVDLAKVPENLRHEFSEFGKHEPDSDTPEIKIGLRDAWELLRNFPGDALGDSYTPLRHKILSFLTARNQSLFAHGTRSVPGSDYADWESPVQGLVTAAVQEAMKTAKPGTPTAPEQLPTDFLGVEAGQRATR